MDDRTVVINHISFTSILESALSTSDNRIYLGGYWNSSFKGFSLLYDLIRVHL